MVLPGANYTIAGHDEDEEDEELELVLDKE